jgi:hypothetical protein
VIHYWNCNLILINNNNGYGNTFSLLLCLQVHNSTMILISTWVGRMVNTFSFTLALEVLCGIGYTHPMSSSITSTVWFTLSKIIYMYINFKWEICNSLRGLRGLIHRWRCPPSPLTSHCFPISHPHWYYEMHSHSHW